MNPDNPNFRTQSQQDLRDAFEALQKENAELRERVRELEKTSPSGKMALEIGALKDKVEIAEAALDYKIEGLK
jgi:cell division septum initiation protein DivIVA